MADVAHRAGVSTATVSHFVSGRPELLKRVGAQARERIGTAIAELGYVRNKTARHLSLQRTERICVLFPQMGVPFGDKIARDIDEIAQLRGYTIVFAAGQPELVWRRMVEEVAAGLADGLIAYADSLDAELVTELIQPLVGIGKPCLVIHAAIEPQGFSVIKYGRTAALEAALEHLRQAGHSRIAYLSHLSVEPSPRIDLVRAWAAEVGLPAPLVVAGAHSRAAAEAAAPQILSVDPRPSVVVCESDFSAVTIIHACHRAGLRVPEDIAVIGCGNVEEGYFCFPRLTTIGPTEMSLTEGTEHLIDAIESGGDAEPRTFLMPWRLYLRESG